MVKTVKTLLRSVREYKKPSLMTPIFMVLEAICECLIPFMMAKMLEGCKNLTVAENNVKIFSALSDESRAQIGALADELCR